MKLYKVDGVTGKKLSGATITVYRSDGSVYFEGVTGDSGMLSLKRPESGNYSFKETGAPPGYYLNSDTFLFTVEPDGRVEGEDTIPNYRKPVVTIFKKDADTSEGLSGAAIEIMDIHERRLFIGTSDREGRVYFEVPAPGEYHFKEAVAPEGYELNQMVFSFTVYEDGRIQGDCAITDRKYYREILSSHAPRTCDTSGLAGLLPAWITSIGTWIWSKMLL